MSYRNYLKMAGCEREFAKSIVMDIAAHTDERKQYARTNKQDVERAELSWFEDLDHGGCRSGLVGMFVYHSDCRAFYQKHASDMEEWLREMEDETGEPIHADRELPRYTWLCWLCYEWIASNIYNKLTEL